MLEDQIQQQNENACISRMMRDSIQKLPILEKQVKFLQDENDFLQLAFLMVDFCIIVDTCAHRVYSLEPKLLM